MGSIGTSAFVDLKVILFKDAFCSKTRSKIHCVGGQVISLRYNERLLARLESEKETPQYKSRTGRLQKWRELCSQALSDLKLPETVPERIQSLSYAQSMLD